MKRIRIERKISNRMSNLLDHALADSKDRPVLEEAIADMETNVELLREGNRRLIRENSNNSQCIAELNGHLLRNTTNPNTKLVTVSLADLKSAVGHIDPYKTEPDNLGWLKSCKVCGGTSHSFRCVENRNNVLVKHTDDCWYDKLTKILGD